MKYAKSLLALLLIFAFSQNIFSQTVDEIINKHVAALGGLDKINSVKTIRYTGMFSGMGADIPVTITIKAKDKIKMDMQFQGMSLIQAYDGITGWSINPFSGKKDAEKMPAEEVKEMKENAEWEGQLVNYKEKGYKVELMDKEDVEGSDTYKIKLTDKDGDVTYYFLDAATYLPIKQTSKRKFKEKEITQEIYQGNYQSVDGIMLAMSIEIKTVGSDQTQKGTFEKVELNVDVDDSFFTMPSK
jgi:outer membrane lipoprotein-sorting protein